MALNYRNISKGVNFDLNGIIIIIGVLVITGLTYLVSAVYQHRSRINRLRKQGWPMPAEWSWFTGHTPALLRASSRLPPLANVVLAIQEICREFPDEEMFILDIWPSYPAVIVTFNPDAGVLMSQKKNLPKHPISGELVKPIVGGPSLLSMNGSEWKIWRSRFNPGFSAASLMGHVPYIVDRVQVFSDKLRASAGRDIISLDEFATRLSFEIIMKVTLDANIEYQRSEHILATAFNTITRWHSFWDIRVLLHPLRPLVQLYYGNIVKEYVRKELERRFAELKAERLVSKAALGSGKRDKSAIALALEAYIAENEGKKDMLEMAKLDDEFASLVTHQIRLFLFAGNDTTSSTIVFIYHLLSKNTEARSQLRQEHNTVFGHDVSKAAARLKEQPALMNQCRYTLAVIKETLRIYPPSANQRQGVPGVSLTTLNGQSLPTDGFSIIVNHHATHQNPRVWVRPEEFLPERWLVQPGDILYPPEGAYRPFDTGPRTCIGQSLSVNEMRIILIMTARTFTIEAAYEEWDQTRARNASLWTRATNWINGVKVNTVNGDRAYQTEKAGSHPSEGYPCRVTLVK